MPRVSVVIPTFDRADFLRGALESVHDQSWSDYEIIVVDDGSEDEEAIRQVCAEFPAVQLIRQPNAGQSAALNRGIEAAQGEWIALLDDDDRWDPDKLRRQFEALEHFPDAALIHCPARVIDELGDETGRIVGDDHPEWRYGNVFEHAVRRCIVKSPTPLVRRQVVLDVGGFDTELRLGQDWDLWARIAYRHSFAFIPEPLASHRIHSGTTTDYSDALSTIRRIRQNLLQFVEPKDRRIVQRELARAALREIPRQTSPRGRQRYAACFELLRNWPRAAAWRSFWGLMVLGETS